MDKVSIPVSCCEVGEILAEDVLNEWGIILVSQNTIINQYIKNKLIEMRIPNILVYMPVSLQSYSDGDMKYNEVKKNYVEVVMSVKGILNELAAGGKVGYEKIFTVSQLIYSSVNESTSLIKCLAEMRNIDEYTYTHSVNVAFYSMLIAKWLNLPEFKIHEAIQAGLLHDIGKVKISDEILNKKGKLTSEEYEVMKKHSIYGYDLIKNMSEFSDHIKNGVLMHHERMDGSGYPYGISGVSIWLYAKIISVSDIYDAMTHDRVYKKKATPFEVFQMFLTTGMCTLDTLVLKTFLNKLPAYFVGTTVELNNGETGEIVYVPPHDIASPVVRVAKKYYDLSSINELKIFSMI
jgi:putative nucleotidyltransferase with HDIG domain